MQVTVATRPTLSVSEPTVAWDTEKLRLVGIGFEILPDGRLIAVQSGESEDQARQVDVIFNFFEMMKSRLAAARKG